MWYEIRSKFWIRTTRRYTVSPISDKKISTKAIFLSLIRVHEKIRSFYWILSSKWGQIQRSWAFSWFFVWTSCEAFFVPGTIFSINRKTHITYNMKNECYPIESSCDTKMAYSGWASHSTKSSHASPYETTIKTSNWLLNTETRVSILTIWPLI